jgi:UrcA family protein
MNRTFGTTLGLIAACLAAPAIADSGVNQNTIGQSSTVLTWADLNLNSEAGRATLERRIESAERQACMSATATGSRIRAAREVKACKAEVRRQVEARLNSQ